MISTSPSISPSSLITEACTDIGVVGDEFLAHLLREIPAKILFRRARDVLLLSGPTGSGKEMVAKVSHQVAGHFLGRNGELVIINCANLGNGVFESELFGYRRGAFTGANRDYAGLAGRASTGTLVLDEVQALSPQDQARLLRFLGERQYRSVGDDKTKRCEALIILASNRDLRAMTETGEFRRDLLDRATAKIHLPTLAQRREDIGELTQAFAFEAARDAGAPLTQFYGLTRRAQADVQAAVIRSKEVSVRRLREVIRDAVFSLATPQVPEAIESDSLLPLLEREFNFSPKERPHQDITEITEDFNFLIARTELQQLSHQHGVSLHTLHKLCEALQTLISEMEDKPRTYRNITERTNRLSKVALWLVSGARTQAEFRKYFGQLAQDMPTKSVAHQIYYDVFPRSPEEARVNS